MSWSINAVGKPAAVAKSCREQISGYKCAEPEEAVRQMIVEAIEAACKGFNDSTLVRVNANGSMYTADGASQYNSASLTIEPILGFVE